eukprot:5124507-Alexandrium_andersonii.AAC.1
MSASLVGSEMCIRDSAGVRTCRHARRRGAACARACKAPGLCYHRAQSMLCLLYTSDAADDM